MKLEDITITVEDIQDILREANPAEPASFKNNCCHAFYDFRENAIIGISILSFVYPSASSAIAALIAILDKVCKED